MKAHDANEKQLEIWRRTVEYEISMMAPYSVPACDAFLERLDLFEKELLGQERYAAVFAAGSKSGA